MVWANGGALISKDGKRVREYFDSREVAQTLDFIKKLVEDEIVPLSAAENSFETEKTAMFLSGPWMAKKIKGYFYY